MPLNAKTFVKILTDRCDIYMNDNSQTDSYGHTIQPAGIKVGDTVPCRLLPVLRRNKDLKGQDKVTISYFSFYIMPFTDPNGNDLNENHWLVIGSARYDIVEVLNPVLAGAPCELLLQLVKP